MGPVPAEWTSPWINSLDNPITVADAWAISVPLVYLICTIISHEQFTFEYGDRVAAQIHALLTDQDVDHAPSCRCLVSHQLTFPQFITPVWAQCAVRRSGDRVLVDPRETGAP